MTENAEFTPTSPPPAAAPAVSPATKPRPRKAAKKKPAVKVQNIPAAKAAKPAAPAKAEAPAKKRGRPKGAAKPRASHGAVNSAAIRALTECKPEDAAALTAAFDVFAGLNKKSRERVLGALRKVFG